jgi:hypothetical protein
MVFSISIQSNRMIAFIIANAIELSLLANWVYEPVFCNFSGLILDEFIPSVSAYAFL